MDFESAYQQLNSAQKQAVDEIEGPVMVVAGPGTGKTQLLSVRVANILRQTDSSPENILCLTFTNKAATNMRERLTQIIGPEARNVVVKTFHSFAAEIMNQYPDEFWNGARLTTVPDSVQLDILQSILQSLPPENPLSMIFAGKYTSLSAVKDGLKLSKEAGLTPAKLRALIEANLAYIDIIEPELIEILSGTLSARKLPELLHAVENLTSQQLNKSVTLQSPLNEVILSTLKEAIAKDEGTGKTTHTSKWKGSWLKSVDGQKQMYFERRRNNWWLALSEVYETYRDRLHERGFYDYSDMLVEVIYQLEQNEALRADVQERFLYVLIDEFQDTNPAQMRLAHLISDHQAAEGRPNIMVVGDDDQSIFKFNGAELNNMLNFRHDYQVKRPIVLKENYRSSQDILNVAEKIIIQAKDRLVNRENDIQKHLVAVNPPDEPGEIQHLKFETSEHQLSAVARKIISLRKDNPLEIAVLARHHDSLQRLAYILQKNNIAVAYERQNNVLEHEATNQVLLIAQLVIAIQTGDKASTNYLLSRLLRHPAWSIESSKLWHLALQNRTKPNWYSSLLESKDLRLKSMGEWLGWLVKNVDRQPLSMTLEQFIGLREAGGFTSPLKEYYISSRKLSQDYLEALSAIQKLRHLAAEFSEHGAGTLSDLVRLIEVSNDNMQVISDESPYVTGANAVQLLTVHKAKGLEFDTVFIIDATEENWQPKPARRKPPANLPLQPYGDTYDDYVRLLYVAATRAKRTIYVSSYKLDAAGKDILPTPLIYGVMPEVDIEIRKEDTVALLEEHIGWPIVSIDDEEVLLRPILDSLSLSPTTLLHFLDVTNGGPATFKENALLRLPAVKSNYQYYGTAIHNTLEAAQKLLNAGSFSLPKLQTIYKKELELQMLAPQEYETYLSKGRQALDKLFVDYEYQLPLGGKPEQKIADVVINDVRVSGKIDRIDVNEDGSLLVVDYKTGSALANFDTKSKQLAVKAWKHKLQLIYYAMLLQETPTYKNNRPISAQMVYVEADSVRKLKLSYTPTDEDIDMLKRLIVACWRHIQALSFPDTSGYEPTLEGIEQFQSDLLSRKI